MSDLRPGEAFSLFKSDSPIRDEQESGIHPQHMDVDPADGARDPFTSPMQNPVPKILRFGGPAYPNYDKPLP